MPTRHSGGRSRWSPYHENKKTHGTMRVTVSIRKLQHAFADSAFNNGFESGQTTRQRQSARPAAGSPPTSGTTTLSVSVWPGRLRLESLGCGTKHAHMMLS